MSSTTVSMTSTTKGNAQRFIFYLPEPFPSSDTIEQMRNYLVGENSKKEDLLKKKKRENTKKMSHHVHDETGKN